jgi:hypothetical protein
MIDKPCEIDNNQLHFIYPNCDPDVKVDKGYCDICSAHCSIDIDERAKFLRDLTILMYSSKLLAKYQVKSIDGLHNFMTSIKQGFLNGLPEITIIVAIPEMGVMGEQESEFDERYDSEIDPHDITNEGDIG